MQNGLHINIFLLLGLIVLYGCRSGLPETQGGTFIQLYKGGCDGPCESYKLSIFPNRKAVLNGLTHSDQKGKYTWKLPKSRHLKLWELVENLDWSSATRDVPPKQPGAQIIYVIYVKDGLRREISYKGRAPLKLTGLVKQLEQLKAAGKWKKVSENDT